MDLKQLECLVRVVEEGSFTKAAVVLELSQPVVSRYVRQLEVELNEHLLLRHGRGVVPTEAGKRLVAHGQGILRQIQVARHELQENRGAPTGRVVVGLPPTIGRAMTVDLVKRFLGAYPHAMLCVVEALTASLGESLLLGRIDVALLYNPAPSAQLRYQPLWAEELFMIGVDTPAKSFPDVIATVEVPQYPLVLPAQPNVVRNLLNARCLQLGVSLRVVAEVSAIDSQLELAEQGVGCAVLPRNAVRTRRGPTRLKAARIVDEPIPTQVMIATSVNHPPSRLAEATVELIRAQVAAGALA